MDLPNEDQGFEILDALAQVQDIGDFRLRQLMSQHGMNPTQPVEFYRQLIKEAREVISLVDLLEQTIDSDATAIAKQRADLSARDEQLGKLMAKVHSLQNGTRQRSETIDNKVRQLEADSVRLQDKVQKYDAITELLKGEIKRTTLKALSESFWDMHTEALNAQIYGRPPPDPGRLDEIRQNLRENLRDILRVPKQELEQEIDTLRAENRELTERYQGLVDILKRAYGGEGDRAS